MPAADGARPRGELRAFTGRYVPGVCFGSGHCLCLYDFDATPTSRGSGGEVWLVTPDDVRIAYVDDHGPEVGAASTVGRYHALDRSVAAEIDREVGDDRITLSVRGDDGTAIGWTVWLTRPPLARLLALAGRLTPRVVGGSTVCVGASQVAIDRLFDRFSVRVAGRTETGADYRWAPTDVALVDGGRATLDGRDLGDVVAPPRPITFGDVRAPYPPAVLAGDLLLEYPA